MFILLNKDNVIIDIVSHIVFVKRDTKNNSFISTDNVMDAIGVYGSASSVFYPIAGRQLTVTYEDITDFKEIENLPEYVTAINYQYIGNEFIVNTEYLPVGVLEAKTNSDAIAELYDMLIAMGGM